MMRRVLETAVILLGTLGWWGFVYPELCLLETSYEETYEDAGEAGFVYGWHKAGADAAEDGAEKPKSFGVVIAMPADDFGAGEPGREVRIKSKIAEYVYQVRNREAEKEVQDDE